MLVFVIIFQLAKCQSWSQTNENPHLFSSIDFPQITVEEGEIYTIELDDYIRGNLLKYELLLYERPNSKIDWENYIKLSTSYEISWYQAYGLNNSLLLHQEPFSHTTLLFQTEDNYQNVYFIDRNFILYKYNLLQFQSKTLTLDYSLQLNTTIINNTCSSLKIINNFKKRIMSLILLCSGVVYNTEEKKETENFYFVEIDISRDRHQLPKAKYFQINANYTLENQNFEIFNIKYDDNNKIDQIYTISVAEKKKSVLIHQIIYDQTNKEVSFVPFDNLEFLTAFANEIKYYNIQIEDIQILDEQCGVVAVLCSVNGIFISQYVPKNLTFFDECQYDEYTQHLKGYIQYRGMQYLFYNDDDPTSLFAAIAYPPKTIEFDISDLLNPYLRKVYSLEGDDMKYIGMYTIASNNQYLVQSLMDMKTFNQFLRFYQRDASQDYYAQFELEIPAMFRSNYFAFPSYFLNDMIYRDEKFINISSIIPMCLQVNYTRELSQLHKINHFENIWANLIIYNNMGEVKSQDLQIVVVPKNNIQINFKNGIFNEDPRYSCGDPLFKFSLDGIVSGPFYRWEISTFNESKNYFTVVNRQPVDLGTTKINLEACDFINMDTLIQQKNEITHFIICSQSKSGIIQLCQIKAIIENNYEYSSPLHSFQDINCNQTKQIVDAVIESTYYDEEANVLMVVARTTSPLNSQKISYYEMHFFEVGYDLIWKKVVQKPNKGFFQNLLISHYNSAIHAGVLIQNNIDQKKITISVISIDTVNYDAEELYQISFDVDPDQNGTVVRTQISNEGFIWILFANNTLRIYEFVYCTYGHTHIKLGQSIYFVKQRGDDQYPFSIRGYLTYDPNNNTELISFDILDNNKYLAIFFEDNTAFIYKIEGYYSISYKMKLPKYGEMVNLAFELYQRPNIYFINQQMMNVVKGPYLLIMVKDTTSNQRNILLFDVSQSQHDCFLYNISSTGITQSTQDVIFHFSFVSDNAILSLFDYEQLTLISLSFSSYLITDPKKQELLFEECKYKLKEFSFLESIEIIPKGQIYIPGFIPYLLNVLFKFTSQNQGLIITPLTNQYNVTLDNKDDKQQSDQGIILHQIFRGRNIHFNIKCEINNEDCKDLIQDQTQPKTKFNLIEFVTNNRKVIRSFNLGEYVFILDSYIKLNLMKIVNTKSDQQKQGDSFNGLIYITNVCQIQTFGCYMKQFTEVFDIMHTNLRSDQAIYKQLYVMQCYQEKNIQVIRFAILTLYKNYFSDDPQHSQNSALITITNSYTTHIQVGTDLIEVVKLGINPIRSGHLLTDVEIIPFTANNSKPEIGNQQNNATQYFYAVFVFENPESFTNYLHIFKLIIFEDRNVTNLTTAQTNGTLTLLKVLTANQIGMASFKAKKVSVSHDQRLLFFTMDWFGIGIINIQFQDFSYYIDFNELLKKKKQVLQYDHALSFTGMVQYSEDCWHIIYSQGILEIRLDIDYIMNHILFVERPQSLTQNISQILIEDSKYEKSTEIASCEYGYVILNYKYVNDETFETYLGFISFQTERNSKLLSEVLLANNTICNSLQILSQQDTKSDKNINVSVICGTNYIEVTFNVYPSININVFDTSPLGYQTKFDNVQECYYGHIYLNISIEASNYISNEMVPIILKVENLNYNGFQLLSILLSLITALVMIAIIFTNNNYNQHDKNEKYPIKKRSIKHKKEESTNYNDTNSSERVSSIRFSDFSKRSSSDEQIQLKPLSKQERNILKKEIQLEDQDEDKEFYMNIVNEQLKLD